MLSVVEMRTSILLRLQNPGAFLEENHLMFLGFEQRAGMIISGTVRI